MSKPRIKPAIPVLANREQAEECMNSLARDFAAKQIQCAEMDGEILAIKERYAPAISVLDLTIQQSAQSLEVWAQSNPGEFPKDRKSLALLAGTIGFRKDTPSLVPLNKTFTWARILATITAKKWRKFIRNKPDVDREAILARSGTLDKPTKFQRTILPLLGLRIAQEEKFFVEPALTNPETPATK